MLLAAGTPGKRLALPNSRILIHQPYTEGTYGQASDIEIQANEILRMRALLEQMIAEHTGKSVEEVSRDIERDKILTAEQAIEYGLIDQVFESRKATPADAVWTRYRRRVDRLSRRYGQPWSRQALERSGTSRRRRSDSARPDEGDVARWHALVTAATC